VYRSIELLKALTVIEPNQFGFIINLLLAALIVLFVTGVFAFVGFAYPTKKLLPLSYYLIKKPAHVSWWYKLLGVKYFKIFLLCFGANQRIEKNILMEPNKGSVILCFKPNNQNLDI
jgi:hypothetical protein